MGNAICVQSADGRQVKAKSIWPVRQALSLAAASSGGPLTSVSSLMTVGRCLLNNVVFACDAPRDHTHINTAADRSREQGQPTGVLVSPKLGKNSKFCRVSYDD